MTALAVFGVQFVYIFLLGIQSRNVRDSQYFAAAITSGLLGCSGIWLTSHIARLAVVEGSPVDLLAYISAGPVAICLAMFIHNRSIMGKKKKGKQLAEPLNCRDCGAELSGGFCAQCLKISTLPDSGERSQFSTGAQRDAARGKGIPSEIYPEFIRRLAVRLEEGALKYDRGNWRKGIPLSRAVDGIKRHTDQAAQGDQSEDHLAAIAFGVMLMQFTLDEIKAGRLPQELNDLPFWRDPE